MKPLTPASPHAIIMVGIPGAGKSSFAEHFAETFQAPIVNLDKLQKDYHLSFHKAEQLRNALLVEFIKTRRTILVEGGTEKKAQRASLARMLLNGGYRPLFVWVQTEPVEAMRRATKKYPAGSGLTEGEFKTAAQAFQAPAATEKALVISGKHTYATQLKIVLRQLATHVERSEPPRQSPGHSSRPRARGVVLR